MSKYKCYICGKNAMVTCDDGMKCWECYLEKKKAKNETSKDPHISR